MTRGKCRKNKSFIYRPARPAVLTGPRAGRRLPAARAPAMTQSRIWGDPELSRAAAGPRDPLPAPPAASAGSAEVRRMRPRADYTSRRAGANYISQGAPRGACAVPPGARAI